MNLTAQDGPAAGRDLSFSMAKDKKRAVRPHKLWRRLYIREHLLARDWDQAELAKRAGISPAEISLIINRKSAGSPESLETIAAALGLQDVGMLFRPPPPRGEVHYTISVPRDDVDRVASIIDAVLRRR